jgi:hypothetical protein
VLRSQVKRRISDQFAKSTDLTSLQNNAIGKRWTVHDVHTEIHEFVHFVYKSDSAQQFITPEPVHPFKGRQGLRSLMHEYKKVYDNIQIIRDSKSHTVYFQASRASTVLAWIRPGADFLLSFNFPNFRFFRRFQTHTIVTEIFPFVSGEFEIYCTFTPLVAKEVAITACNRALRWIKREEGSLFMLHANTW